MDDDPARGSGLDARKTPGYGVLDLFAGWHPSDAVWVRLGIDNLTDKAYADHLNRADQDPFNPLPVQVNEPGRVAWLRLSSEF